MCLLLQARYSLYFER